MSALLNIKRDVAFPLDLWRSDSVMLETDQLLSLLPAHECGLSIEHNEHKVYYESIGEYLGRHEMAETWKDKEAWQRMMDTDEIWEMQWFPRTPVVSAHVCAPTLSELLEWAKEVEGKV